MFRIIIGAWLLMLAFGIFHGSHPGVPAIGYFVAAAITAVWVLGRRYLRNRRQRPAMPIFRNGQPYGRIR